MTTEDRIEALEARVAELERRASDHDEIARRMHRAVELLAETVMSLHRRLSEARRPEKSDVSTVQ
jgi:predicted ribosome quality control (RQC) complex YloA/Tae2 family protein